MKNIPLLQNITDWHAAKQHNKICEAILALPENERTDEMMSLLARSLSNKDNYNSALEILDQNQGSLFK
ncbi:MAG: hypothetical protein ACRCWR_12140 [Saezia sp.]